MGAGNEFLQQEARTATYSVSVAMLAQLYYTSLRTT